jgi:hypothetical protein
MGISGPTLNSKDDNIIIKDRRQLLVKVGSFMKSSWRRSTDKITDSIDDMDNKNSDDVDIKNNRRIRRKHNFFVQFDDEVYAIPSLSSCSFDTFSTSNNNNNNNTFNNEEQETRTQPMSDTEPNEEQEQAISSYTSSYALSWYQRDDYCKFKKDMILNSLNYINAKRASKVFDEEKCSIRGIEHMCSYASGDPNYRRRQTSEKKYLYKVIRDEQNKQQKQNCTSTKNPYTKYDMDKFRSVSLTQTKNGRDRAISLGNEYAREQRQQQQKDEQQNLRNNNNNNNNTNNRCGGGFASSPSMKNIFLLGRQIQNN